MIRREQVTMSSPNDASSENVPARADVIRLLLNALIVGAVTYVCARFALAFRIKPYHIAPLWPASAILFSVLVWAPVRTWTIYILVWLLSNIIVDLQIGDTPRAILCFLIGNTIEVLIATVSVRRLAGGLRAFSNLRGLVAYILFAVVLAPFISAFVGAFNRAGGNYWFDWRVWFLGDVISFLTLAPAIMTWIASGRAALRKVSLARCIEAALVGCGLLAISVFVFIKPTSGQHTSPALLYLPLPALLWAAVRFGPTGLLTSLLLVAFLSISGAVEGHGPFVTTMLVDNVLSLQLFLITISLPLMFLTVLIEERRKSTNVLRESEARINLAANAAHLGLWHCNVQDKELWVTEKWRELFGFTDSEPVAFDRLLQVVHPEDRERMKQLVQSMFKHGGENESEYRIKLPDGSTRWISGYGTVELDERGKPAFARGVSRDITLRKHAEEELLESEARFRAMANTAPVMIWVSGPDRLCTFFNKGWLDFTGRTLEEELGNKWAEGVHREDIDRCMQIYARSFDARQPFTMEYRLRRSDGEYRLVLDTGTPRFAPDGEFLGYIGSCIDITERKQAELQHQRQNLELARVGRVAVMGELAASLAHEVNNPVGAMVANASAGQRLLAAGKIKVDDLTELLADIVTDGRRAGEVIQGIRNLVRKGEARRELIQIEDIIQQLLRIVHADAIERDVKVVTEVNPGVGQVWGDPVQLLQVFLNLTLNAFEAMTAVPSNARRLVIHAAHSENGDILVSFRDSGPGFPSGMAQQLFEPFFSTKAEGTGMGLAIACSLIEAHSGTLSAENCEGGGACFTVRLPQKKQDNSTVREQ